MLNSNLQGRELFIVLYNQKSPYLSVNQCQDCRVPKHQPDSVSQVTRIYISWRLPLLTFCWCGVSKFSPFLRVPSPVVLCPCILASLFPSLFSVRVRVSPSEQSQRPEWHGVDSIQWRSCLLLTNTECSDICGSSSQGCRLVEIICRYGPGSLLGLKSVVAIFRRIEQQLVGGITTALATNLLS